MTARDARVPASRAWIAAWRPVLGVAAVTTVAFHGFAAMAGLPTLVTFHARSSADRVPGVGESLLVLLALLACGPVVAAVRDLPHPTQTEPRRAMSTTEVVRWASLHLLLVILTGTLLTRWGAYTDDEDAYLVQARALLTGQATEPAWLPASAQNNPFLVEVLQHGAPRTAGVYPLAAPLLTAPGLALGFPNLLWAPLGALVVLQVGGLARRLVDGPSARLATAVTTTSPLLIGLSASKHTSIPSTLLALTAARLALAASDGRRAADLALGSVVGLGILTRPLDGALVAIAVVLYTLLAGRRHPAAWLGRGLRLTIGGLPTAAVWMVYNDAITGHPFRMGYSLLFDGARVYGFGQTAFGEHTPLRALGMLSTTLLRLNVWAFGWGVGLSVVVAAARGAATDRRLAALLALGGAHLGLYALAPFGQVPTVGLTYSVWLVPVLALALGVLSERAPVVWTRRAIVLSALGWTTFVPYAAWGLFEEASYNRAPLDAAAKLAAEHGEVLLIHHSLGTRPIRGSVFSPPMPAGPDAPVVWWYDAADPARRADALAAFPDRPAFTVAWTGGATAALQIERIR